MAQLADELAYRSIRRKTSKFGGWINFGSREWKQICSRGYGDIKKAAVEQGLIELNEKYSSSDKNSKGRPFPKSLRLTKLHRHAKLVPYTLAKPIRRNSKSNITIADDDDVGNWLASKLAVVSFKADLDLTAIESHCKSQAAKNSLRASEQRLRQGRLNASRCSFGRFHSNFTNMKKELRRQLTWNDEPLIAVDIKNSQPALLPYVIGRHIGDCGDERHKGFGYGVREGLDIDRIANELDFFSMSLGAVAGQFYERVAVSSDLSQLSRDSIKTLFFQSIYGEQDTTQNSDLFKLFNDVSPLFADGILDIKEEKHAALAHKLQRAESDIVIERCCRRLMELEPQMPLITVHDELMTTAEHKNLVVYQLTAAFFEKCGYPCAVSVTNPVI